MERGEDVGGKKSERKRRGMDGVVDYCRTTLTCRPRSLVKCGG